MASNLLSFGLWYFVPNLVTGWIQTIYYRVAYSAGEPIPQPGHPRYAKDRRNIFILVIGIYFLYTVYEADWQLQRDGDFYSLLGVPFDADERKIQSQFRRLTVRYHPDKITDAALRPFAEQLYIRIKLARDTLVDPVKRFAYDRFGPSMLEWPQCKTIHDYALAGAARAAPIYIGSLIFLVISGLLGYMESGRYWRYVVLASVVAGEMYTITRPFYPPVLSRVVNPILVMAQHQPYLPFQAISFARKISISIFIAINQLAPLFKQPVGGAGSRNDAATQQQIDRLAAVASALDMETKRLLGLELSPFREDQQLEARARDQLKAWLVRNEIRNEPGVSAAIARAIRRRGGQADDDDGAG